MPPNAERQQISQNTVQYNYDSILYSFADLLEKVFHIKTHVNTGEKSIGIVPVHNTSQAKQRNISAKINDHSIQIKIELLKVDHSTKMRLGAIIEHFAKFDAKIKFEFNTDKAGQNQYSVFLIVPFSLKPVDFSRTKIILSELQKIENQIKAIEDDLPEFIDTNSLADKYDDVINMVDPVVPLDINNCPPPDFCNKSINDSVVFLMSGLSIALVTDDLETENFYLSLLAYQLGKQNESIGKIKLPACNISSLLELLTKTPGILVVPSTRIQIASNSYQLNNDISNFLSVLKSRNTPMIISGNYTELQSLFQGGQGGQSNPMMPVVQYIPRIPFNTLVKSEIFLASIAMGGLSKKEKNELEEKITHFSATLNDGIKNNELASIIKYDLSLSESKSAYHPDSLENYFKSIRGLTETLTGLKRRPKFNRSNLVEDRLSRIIINDQFSDYIKSKLLGQDAGITDLVHRLNVEILTRPLNQPIRICIQGTPATGKSDVTILLAKFLDIPHVNIDAASLPDYYTASSQLLGSGRGIVGSFQSGRLEQISKHHEGAVVEISDLDHASPQVRSLFADLFLQVLESGEAQSATGAMFSCANLIFIFTINLPDGKDEKLRRGYGFYNDLSKDEIEKRVTAEIRQMFSSAFLSRIGRPILFAPLNKDILAQIAEREIVRAIETALFRIGQENARITHEKDLGYQILKHLPGNIESFGARGIMEQTRNLTTSSLLNFLQKQQQIKSSLILKIDAKGKLLIECQKN